MTAKTLNISYGSVYSQLSEYIFPKKYLSKEETKKRNKELFSLYESGMTTQELAIKFVINVAYVRNIITMERKLKNILQNETSKV